MTKRQAPPELGTVDRPLPHNLEAERAVLGAVLIHNSAFDQLTESLGARHFFRDAHRRVFEAMVGVIDDRKSACDFTTLIEELNRRGDLAEVGGASYVASLVDGLPHATNVLHYAAIVREKATLRGVIHAANKVLAQAYDAIETPTTILRGADLAFLDLQQTNDRREAPSMQATARELFTDLEERVAKKGQLWGIDTGFKSINDETMGWQAGDLIVIAARPSVGKTTFALNSALAAARGGKRVAIFSLEMRRRQLDYRIVSSLSKVPSRKILGGFLANTEFQDVGLGLNDYANLPVFIDDRAGQTIADIRMACRRLRSEGGLDLVMIDYVQLIPGTLERRGATRNEEITDISQRTKNLAGELGVPIFLISQLKRIGSSRPTLEDLRDSGSLEQDADMVCFLHRKNHKEGGLTNFIIEKARNGPTGTVNLHLDRDTTTFTDAGEETEEQHAAATEEQKHADRTKAIIRSRGRKSA